MSLNTSKELFKIKRKKKKETKNPTRHVEHFGARFLIGPYLLYAVSSQVELRQARETAYVFHNPATRLSAPAILLMFTVRIEKIKDRTDSISQDYHKLICKSEKIIDSCFVDCPS